MKRSKLLLLAAIIATACFVYVVSYMYNSDTSNGAVAVAMTLALPSVIFSGLGTLFSWIGFFAHKKGFALAAGILFAVSIFLMFPWIYFNVIQMILCFIAFATMKVKKET